MQPVRILIAIPTYNRLLSVKNRVSIFRNSGLEYKYFVDKSQVLGYLSCLKPDEIVQVEDNLYICGKMQKIGEYALKKGYTHVFKVDDDMSFKRLDKSSASECLKIAHKELSQIFDANKNIGIATLTKAIAYIKGSKRSGYKISNKKPISSNYCVEASMLLKLKKKYILFDDYLMSLIAILASKDQATLFCAYENGQTHKNKGGLQSFDRNDLGKIAYKEISQDFPKSKLGFDPRHNCTDLDLSAYYT